MFVVGGVGLQAAMEDADESVGELAQGGVVVLAAGGELVVVGPGAGEAVRAVKAWRPRASRSRSLWT